ncbi:MAG: TetR/AcrR family transcriptional regulator [Myxococcota bacterium]
MPSDLRERILQEATTLFANQGYAATSMRTVAEAVGCTKPALYYHFSNKEELFLEAVGTNMNQFTALIEQTLSQPGTLHERLLAGMRTFFTYIQHRPESMRLLMTAQHRPDEGSPEIDLISLHQEQSRMLIDILKHARQQGEIRDNVDLCQLSTSLDGLIQIWGMRCVHGQPIPEKTPEHILDLFFHGVAPT